MFNMRITQRTKFVLWPKSFSGKFPSIFWSVTRQGYLVYYGLSIQELGKKSGGHYSFNIWPHWCINKQQKFYSLPEHYKRIRRFRQLNLFMEPNLIIPVFFFSIQETTKKKVILKKLLVFAGQINTLHMNTTCNIWHTTVVSHFVFY